MNRIICFLVLNVVAGFLLVQTANAQESDALKAAKAASAEPVAAPAAAAENPPAAPTPAAETPKPAADPVVVTPVSSPPPVEPSILKQLRDHTPIPIRSSIDQGIDKNGNRTMEYDEIKDYLRDVRAASGKGRQPTNTDILYHFDKNHDGYMDGGEIGAAEAYIH